MKKNSDVIWSVFDEIAAQKGWATSRLARMAGMDATAFNPSKRISPSGLPHYPAFSTVLAVLKVAELSWFDFAELWQKCSKDKGDKKCKTK